MPIPRRNRLSSAEAVRACYLDFEGRKDRPPILAGWALRGGQVPNPRVHQILLDPRFAPLRQPGAPAICALPDFIKLMVEQAESEDRLIVAWSEHELRLVRQYCSVDLATRFESRFVNARKVAVRWTNTRPRDERPAEHSLAAYLALVGYALPPEAGPGRVGSTIGIIERSLARNSGRRSALTVNQIGRFDQLREHNRHDCLGMRLVCRLAAAGLERAQKPPHIV